MPLLTITTSKQSPDRDQVFLNEIAETYAERMDSETDFLTIRCWTIARDQVWLGRADPDADVFILEADVRTGRSLEQRREFAVAVMDYIHEEWSLPHPNMKVVFTEHDGSHMMGYTRIGSDWEPTSN